MIILEYTCNNSKTSIVAIDIHTNFIYFVEIYIFLLTYDELLIIFHLYIKIQLSLT
jgi:hypothetical protein